MPSAIILPSVVSEALGKQFFCRVPDGMHSANLLALGKSAVSGSARLRQIVYTYVICCIPFNLLSQNHVDRAVV